MRLGKCDVCNVKRTLLIKFSDILIWICTWDFWFAKVVSQFRKIKLTYYMQLLV